MSPLQHVICAALVSLLANPGIASAEQAPETPARKMVFNIAEQPLGDALRRFGEQTGLQVVLYSQIGRGLKAPRVAGDLTPRVALDRLLANTGLKYEYLNASTVAISDGKAGDSSSTRAPADQMRLAVRVEDGPQAQTAAPGPKEKADVVVEGERDRPAPFSTANLDLTRTEDDALPFQVFEARDIELSGASDLQEFLQNRLPQNFSAVFGESDDTADVKSDARRGQVDLRGWGADETVFLLNGRRMPAQYQITDSHGVNATPDLRGIPLGSIERIEILSSAASAIYGAGATGGVINIITRQDFKGGQLAVDYQTPADTHAPRRSVNLSYGMALPWGLGLRLGGSYSDSAPLTAGDRAEVSIARWRQLAMERDPARVINQVSGDPFRTSTEVTGATPNIRATSTSGNLFSGLPGAQASNYTTVPAGSTGGSALSAYQPGVYNLELAEGAAGIALFAKDSTLGTVASNRTLSLGIDKHLGERWRWSLDARYTGTENEGTESGQRSFSSTASLMSRPPVPAAAPTNPFNQTVRVSLVDPNLNRAELRGRQRSEGWVLSSTLRGAVGRWRGFLDVSYADYRSLNFSQSFLEPDGGWTAAFLSGAYNPFVDPRVAAPAAPGFYEHYIASRGSSASATRTYRAAIKASGPLLSLPAGTLQLTAGVDASRTDRYLTESDHQYLDSLTGQPSVPSGGASPPAEDFLTAQSDPFVIDMYAGYAEATIPLLSAAQGVPLMERLELFGSGRLARRVTSGIGAPGGILGPSGFITVPPPAVKASTTSYLYAFGLRYEPAEGFAFRATQSIGFKPPEVSQLVPAAAPPFLPLTGLNDPLRDGWSGVLTNTMYVTGGNPGLKPETTDSTNFGLILTPRRVPGLRVSVDYVESVRNDAISSLMAQNAINLESELPGLVQRGAPDGHPSGVGPITFLDLRNINLAQIASRSVDFSVEKRWENIHGGRLVLRAAASRNISFKVQLTDIGPAVEQVRNPTGAFSRQIEWNGNAQVRWEGPRWSVGWSTRYLDYLLLPQPPNNPTQWFPLQGSDRAPRALNHDLNVSYRAPAVENPRGMQALLSGTSITFGVRNVFDRTPRFWAPSTDRGIVTYDSITGRSVWMQLRRDFN